MLSVRVGEVVGTVGGVTVSMEFDVVLIRAVEIHNDDAAWLNHVEGATRDCLLGAGSSARVPSSAPADVRL